MNVMKNRFSCQSLVRLGFAACVLGLSSPVRAHVDVNRFFCSEIPQTTTLSPKLQAMNPNFPPGPMNPMMPVPQMGYAIQSQTVVKDCGDKKITETANFCIVMAKCVYVTPEIEKSMHLRTGREFSQMTEQEKSLQLVNYHTPDALDALLTCRSDNSGNCPTPDRCKGDRAFNLKIAPIHAMDLNQIQQRAVTGQQRTFQPESTAQPAK